MACSVHASVSINEMMSSNVNTILDDNGVASDWIELYNNGTGAFNLSGCYLTDTPSNLTEWVFPERILSPNQYLIVWASSSDSYNTSGPLHTNFAIKAGGEPIILTAPDGLTQISAIPAVALTADQSYGRFPDGSSNLIILPAPSPGGNNSVLPPPNAPIFSKGAGFYNSSFLLTITTAPNTTIYYTLDGSIPTALSLVYKGPITISNATSNPNTVSMVNTTSPFWAPPSGQVRKGTVVRALAIRSNQSSKITSATYFLDGNFTMPVISISTDSATLFDYNTGIYTMGAAWDNATNWAGTDIFHPANYQNDGDAWERPVHLEIFWNNGSRIVNQDIGVRVSGQGSRVRPQKSLKLYARAEYGTSSIFYPLFPQLNYTDYKRLSIRNGDDDLRATYLRDILADKLVEGTPLAMEPYYPSVLFLNGEYWGFYPMRDRSSQFYLASRYGVNKDNVIILKDNSVIDEGSPGDEQPYLNMVEYVRTHDMSNAANYAYIQTLMDTNDFARYYSVNTFVANTDWIDRNLVYWRLKTNGTNMSAPFGQDGRWRWIMHDNDWSFGYQPGTSASTNMFDFINSKTWGATLWNGLSKNEQFRDYYLTLSADQLMTNFSSSNVISTLDQLAAGITPEIQREIDRWGDIPDISTWQQNLEGIRQFALDRPAYYRQQTISFFGLGGTANLNVDRSGDGVVSINSITPNSYPWTGVEFRDIPVKLTAIAGAGSTFIGWEGAASGTNPQIQIVLSQAASLRAVFAPVGSNATAQGAPIWVTRKYPATLVNTTQGTNSTLAVEVANPGQLALLVEWKLDGNVAQNNGLSYNLQSLAIGSHVVELKIQASSTIITQIWNIYVSANSYTCYNTVQELPLTCQNGEITGDTYIGCRVVTCTSALGSVTATACNKPGDYNPAYYEMYRTAATGTYPNVCLGATCISTGGYSHSNLPQCIPIATNQTNPVNQTNQTNQTNPVNQTNQTICYNSIKGIPVTCSGTITADTVGLNGCRSITCVNGANSLQVNACNKPGDYLPKYFEIYRQASSGVPPQICIDKTCISSNGFASGPNYPICVGNTTGNSSNGTLQYGLTVVSTPSGNLAINSVNYGTTPKTAILAPGTYFVSVSAPGFGSNTTTVILAGNLTLNLLLQQVSPSNNTNQTTNETNQTACFSSVLTIPASCAGGTITQDTVSGSCRTLICVSGSNNVKAFACDKPDIGAKTYFEMYKQASSGIAPKLCIDGFCIQNNGYAKSSNYPICIGNASQPPITPPVTPPVTPPDNSSAISVVLSSAAWYPQGLNQIWVCSASGGSGSYTYDFTFGDGSQQFGMTANNVYHAYPAAGTYSVKCTVHDTTAGTATSVTTSITL